MILYCNYTLIITPQLTYEHFKIICDENIEKVQGLVWINYNLIDILYPWTHSLSNFPLLSITL